ncbi:MAG: restriction endonuclease [Solirubrobacterales bacterium]|nr:restriction endonuclease [Solirubrobacterales bacterium]
MNPTAFEEFCFELLNEIDGFKNVDWRKGTPKDASPADGGRDIVAETEVVEIDGATHTETWFIDCKHYSTGVSPSAIQGLLTWASAERPDVALIVASGYLSNPCKDYIALYTEENRPPFRIKFWERPHLDRLTRDKEDFLSRFLFSGNRSDSEILAAEGKLFDRIWYERKLDLLEKHKTGERVLSEDHLKAVRDTMVAVMSQYSDVAPIKDDFEWGMMNGKLSALRWVLGDEWDNLDT